jgi:thiamine pyrophosphate-dependent acetolactate synthase large subunit-like protein
VTGTGVTGTGAPCATGADAVVRALAGAGTRMMFGVPGGGPNLDVVGAAAAGAAGESVTTAPELTATLAAALRRDGPTVIDARVDPAGYPAIMDLTRGAAGRRHVPGLAAG